MLKNFQIEIPIRIYNTVSSILLFDIHLMYLTVKDKQF